MAQANESGIKTGFVSALVAAAVLSLSTVPARAQLLIRGWGPWLARLERTLAGALIDAEVALKTLLPGVTIICLILAVAFAASRRARIQQAGAALVAWPVGFAVWLFTVIAQEVKAERGSFPTLFDLAEGFGNASFVQGSLEFIAYQRIFVPAIFGATVSLAAIVLLLRRVAPPVASVPAWFVGLTVGFAFSVAVLSGGVLALGALSNRLSAAALGDPLTGIFESALDLLRGRGAATPRALVLDAELPATAAAEGSALLGWPEPPATSTCQPHPFRRSLDATTHTMPVRGERLLQSFQQLSAALFDERPEPVAVFFLSLEGFRADDIHALNPQAPADVAPFTTALYEKAKHAGQTGVLASSGMYQGGVRTAHCLGSMTCGLGTLPYNLSFIRDLQPIALRCTSDVLASAGFANSFFYGSDAKFDGMDVFFHAHGFEQVVDQSGLPKNAPKGTWSAVTDFAVFDYAVTQVAAGLKSGRSQFSFVMSLSNHSPFTEPEDFPQSLKAKVTEALRASVNRADADDVKRVMTHAYTDAALERLFGKAAELGVNNRMVVVLMADHSTGHNYIWGHHSDESDAEKAKIPFAIVVSPQLLAESKNPQAVASALEHAQEQLNAGVLSQNDVPALVLALLQNHQSIKSLSVSERWHSMGGQVTSGFFKPPAGATIMGVNGVSEFYALDEKGKRVGEYEDSVFLKTRADRYRVTPTLIPITATLARALQCQP
jgi:Sulfatase